MTFINCFIKVAYIMLNKYSDSADNFMFHNFIYAFDVQFPRLQPDAAIFQCDLLHRDLQSKSCTPVETGSSAE